MQTNEEYTLKTFEYHKDKFNVHMKEVEKTDDYSIVYSSSYLDYLPFESEMDQLPKATIYKRVPKNLDDKVANYFHDNQLCYCKVLNDYDIWFYQIKDEHQNNIVVHYCNVKKKPKLNQISILIYQEDRLHQVLFYHSDKNFFEDTYSYTTEGKINEIVA